MYLFCVFLMYFVVDDFFIFHVIHVSEEKYKTIENFSTPYGCNTEKEELELGGAVDRAPSPPCSNSSALATCQDRVPTFREKPFIVRTCPT